MVEVPVGLLSVASSLNSLVLGLANPIAFQ